MYIELWQVLIPIGMGATAYFTWNKAHKAGVAEGMVYVITDLSNKGVVSVATSDVTGEIVVGRHDEDLVEELEAIALENEDDEGHY